MAAATSAEAFARAPLPRLCHLDRLLHAMDLRGLDGIVATLPQNVFHLTSLNGVAHNADEPGPYAVMLVRAAAEHPVLVVADHDLATFPAQPSWVQDIRPYRAVMMPMDLPPRRADIDRFIPAAGAGVDWLEHAGRHYSFDMASAVRGALSDLRLGRGRAAFDDMGFGFRLGLESPEVVDGYDPLMFARAVKTAPEMRLLERATRLNEAAIARTIGAWEKGCTWRDLNRAHASAVADLGGFVRDPGGKVRGHPRGADPAICLSTGREDDGRARRPRRVRLPRHARSLLLGRRQDLGRRRRARRRRQAVCQGDRRGRRSPARRHAAGPSGTSPAPAGYTCKPKRALCARDLSSTC
jgi:hypothetical protein